MSLYPAYTNINPADEFFVNDTANISFISSINVFNGSLNTGHIQLDQVGMDCAILNSSPTLLLNGIPVASVSSFASSITQWASYPALAPISYATGVGSGGAINMANVNALSNVSSASGTFGLLSTIGLGSIGGSTFPNAPQYSQVTSMSASLIGITNGSSIRLNFTGQANGFYLISCSIQSAAADPFSCTFTIYFTGGLAQGGGTHMPTYGSPYGSIAPNPQNVVVCQSETISDPHIDIFFFSNGQGTSGQGILGSSAQVSVFRLP
jgi:hypothetical protein